MGARGGGWEKVPRPREAVYHPALNAQLARMYDHLDLPSKVFGLPGDRFEDKRGSHSAAVDVKDILARILTLLARGKSLADPKVRADVILQLREIAKGEDSGIAELEERVSSDASLSAALTELAAYKLLPSAVLGFLTGGTVVDVAYAFFSAMGGQVVDSLLAKLQSPSWATSMTDSDVRKALFASLGVVTDLNAGTIINNVATYLERYHSSQSDKLKAVLDSAGAIVPDYQSSMRWDWQEPIAEGEDDPRGETWETGASNRPVTRTVDGKAVTEAAGSAESANPSAAEKFIARVQQAQVKMATRAGYKNVNPSTLVQFKDAATRAALREEAREALAAKNPMAGGREMPVTASGTDPTHFASRPHTITPTLHPDGSMGMHVSGSQILCTMGDVAGSLVGELFQTITDGADISTTTFSAQKAIAVNPYTFGFMLRELANNYSMFKFEELELCIGTRVGTSTEGAWVISYCQDGAMDITQPGGTTLSPAVASSFDNSVQGTPYSNCGAMSMDGNHPDNCWRMPRPRDSTADHWFYCEGERQNAANYNSSVARDVYQGLICGVNWKAPGPVASAVWQTLGVRYSISFKSPNFDWSVTSMSKVIKQTLGAQLASVLFNMLTDPRLVCGVAWLLGLSCSLPEDTSSLNDLVQSIKVLLPGLLPDDATADKLVPALYAFREAMGPPPGLITTAGWVTATPKPTGFVLVKK